MIKAFVIFLFLISNLALAKGVVYVNKYFAHAHKTANKRSEIITTLTCGHPLRIKSKNDSWVSVKVMGEKGFILTKNVSNKMPDCFQLRYNKFFNSMNLDLAELYYWGRLYDLYIDERSKVK